MRRLFGPEAGVQYSRTPLDFEEDSHTLYNYRSTDGQYNNPIGKPVAGGPPGYAQNPYSAATIVNPYVGAHYRNVRNVIVALDKKKRPYRSNQNVADLYADVMVGVVKTIDDVIYMNGKKWQIAPQNGATRTVGWRIGYSVHRASTFSGITT
mgnify:CR=1 FL=1